MDDNYKSKTLLREAFSSFSHYGRIELQSFQTVWSSGSTPQNIYKEKFRNGSKSEEFYAVFKTVEKLQKVIPKNLKVKNFYKQL
jgi:hypothetical protein